ncbi:hypothetical protein LT330_001995 [Penicillium expansum]|nr:hypothetical protein LT330_001995 [Penicillium expansum]
MEYSKLSTFDTPSAHAQKSSSEDPSFSSQPLLSNEEDMNLDVDGYSRHDRRQSFIRAVIIHSLIFLTYTLAFVGLNSSFRQKSCPPQLTYSPIQGAVSYEKTWYDGSLGNRNRYIGEPRPELEEAWHELTVNNNLKLTQSELQKLNKSAIELSDGSGYFGQVMVYHHLHCLKFLREALYPDAYEGSTMEHLDHCVDDIRQALMCNPDISASTFFWEDGVRRPQPDFTLYKTCVNWEHFDAWATERQFSMFDQKSLINPVYGEFSNTTSSGSPLYTATEERQLLGIAFPMVNGSIEFTPPGPDMHVVWPEEGQMQEELLDTRSPPSVFQVLVLASGFGTLQLVFALLASYGSAQLLSVGVSQAATGLIWLSGPLAGTFIQPLIGIISDKFGHQKIIVATGVIGLVVSLLGLGWAPDLKDEKCELAKALVVLSICTLNIVVQPVQLGLRILIIEACRLEQQTMVSAWVVRMIGIGNILAQLAGSVDTTILRPFTTGSHFKDLCLLTSIGLIITTVGLGLFVGVERTPRSVSEKLNIQQSRSVGLWKAIRTVSPGVLSVWKVQVFSWMGWFQFLYYVTMYIDYLGLHDLLQDSAITDEEAQRSIKTESLQFGSRAMLLNACVSFISSMLLPWLFKGNGTVWSRHDMHFVGNVSCRRNIHYQHSWPQLVLHSLDPLYIGLIMSLHNVSIAAPQILAALIAGSIFWASRDGENQARYVLAVGGVFGLGAAWMAKNLTIEKELH